MSPETERLLVAAMALPESERLELAAALLAATAPSPPALSGSAWLAEFERRSAEIDDGQSTLSAWSDVKRRVRARLDEQGGG